MKLRCVPALLTALAEVSIIIFFKIKDYEYYSSFSIKSVHVILPLSLLADIESVHDRVNRHTLIKSGGLSESLRHLRYK